MHRNNVQNSKITIFKPSKWRVVFSILFMCCFEYFAIKMLMTPYSELQANADKYHPIFAYLFFGSIAPLFVGFIISWTIFLFKKDRGFHLTSTGFVDLTTPFAFGEIPFERVLQICNSVNNVTRFRGIKIRENKIKISLRVRKVDNAWRKARIGSGIKGKIQGWYTRFNSCDINTKLLSASHSEVVSAIEEHIKLDQRIKMYTMDVEQTFKELKQKRKAEKANK